jgi:hypothetical protein
VALPDDAQAPHLASKPTQAQTSALAPVIFGDANFRQTSLRFTAKMDFGSVGKFNYHLC